MSNRSPVAAPADGNRKAAWTLVVLAPVSAEATFSGVTMPAMWLLLPALVVMYGAGVLFLRELVVRFGGGWPSLLVMGLVYELVEDGLGLQALTSPNLYHAAEWGPRILGFNTVYWESQIGYHTVFSVLIPVLLADLLFPSHRGRPYLRRGGLATAAVAAVIGVVLLRLFIPATQDPGYQTPLSVVLAILIAITALLVIALRVLPGWNPPAAPAGRTPHRVVVAVVAGVAAACFLGLLMPLGLPPDHLPDGPAVGSGGWVAIPMIVAAAIAATAGWLVYRWSATAGWSDQHWIWLAGGALIGRTLFAVVTAPAANDYDWGSAGLAIAIGIVMIAAMAYLLSRLNQRIQSPQKRSVTT
ncbi:hypothetical protein OHA40_31755 [Nocardia sp. NBC_00508]|uniref:hypothetical protein n=1 Tax=Nocardia sp. NBC_00508 TaxID=2975992 RepID=UPI002E821525|nr:hypothetical protein [Nocardia sp. NBC_00508]WUD66097.1 hypothetical protein OHA40_31755 [Nocardia sp. NBC_00508]